MVDGGYDISNYTKVNSIYGTNEDLVELFKEAKKLDLKIILDFVSWRNLLFIRGTSLFRSVA